MTWDATQQPWLVSFPDPKRNGARAYEPAFSFPYNFTPNPPDTDVAKSSKWLPTYPQPVRSIVYDALGTSFATWIYDPTHSDPQSQLGWQPSYVQPSRQTFYASGTDSVTSLQFQGLDLPQINFSQTSPQPNRSVLRAQGTDKTSVLWFPSVETYQPGWQSTIVQPQRPIGRAQGTEEVDPFYGFTTTTEDRWHPTYTQPSRSVSLPIVGSTFVSGLAHNTEDIPSHFGFSPTYVQPARPIVYDTRGTSFATWIYDSTHADPKNQLDWLPTYKDPERPTSYAQGSVATPTYFAHAVYAGDWQPTYTQPSRATGMPGGTTYASPGTLGSIAPSFEPMPVMVQPARDITRPVGSHSVLVPVQPAPAVFVNSWAPTYVQPNRPIVRHIQFSYFAADFRLYGAPDPLRGISSPMAPDPNHGVSS